MLFMGDIGRFLGGRAFLLASRGTGFQKGLQGIEGHQAGSFRLAALLEGNRLHQPTVEQVVELRLADAAVCAGFRDAEPVLGEWSTSPLGGAWVELI